jgi:iron complex outermembrane receptor protein
MMKKFAVRDLALIGLLPVWGSVWGQNPEPVPDMSLEDLINTEVVSASRKSQSLRQVAAAVFVITQEDIARSGARSLPDVLAMAPGIEVAHIGNNRWAVSARGDNGRFANKLQVLKDGRSIYSPLFSGVFWEAEDTVLEDIERIEIIRGPNAAMWGSNAVNGTINIITRKARDTQGGLVAVSAGSEDKSNLTARYGMQLGDAGHARLYAKGVSRRGGYTGDGSRAGDKGDSAMAGFRADWLLSSGNRLSLNGETYSDHNDDTYRFPDPLKPAPAYSIPLDSTFTLRGGHLQGRFESLRDDGSEIVFQSYFTQRTLEATSILREERRTLDLDFQYRFAPSGGHDVMLGANYRDSSDKTSSPVGSYVTFAAPNRDFKLASVFFNDEITLVPDRVRTTFGARLEHNNFSGTDLQPTARFLWTPNTDQTVWGAVSRATHTPSRAEADASIPQRVLPPSPTSPFPVLVQYGGIAKGELKSEKMDAAELGYRHRLGHQLSVDATVFSHRYQDSVSSVLGTPGIVPNPAFLPMFVPLYIVQPVNSAHAAYSRVHGLELTVFAQMTPSWRLQPSYTRMQGADEAGKNDMKNAPKHQLSLRSQHNIGQAHQFDLWLKFKSRNEARSIPSRTNLDLRYAWKASRSLEISLVGQNLLHSRTLEYTSDTLPSVPVETGRGAYLRAEYRF